MPIELKMPALSPTMEEGTLAKWLVKEGDEVKSGDLLAEIETDKATMEFEAIDEGIIAQILVPEGSDNVKVGTVIAVIAGEGEDASSAKAAPAEAKKEEEPKAAIQDVAPAKAGAAGGSAPTPAAAAGGTELPSRSAGATDKGERVKASPLAKRLADEKGIDLKTLTGSGPGGRIVKADLEGASAAAAAAPATAPAAPRSEEHTSELQSLMRISYAVFCLK